LFSDKDPWSLEQTVLLSNSRTPPQEPIGAQYCLNIDGGENDKNIYFCANDEKEFLIYKKILQIFDDCRSWKLVPRDDVPAPEKKEEPVTKGKKPAAPSMPDLAKKCWFDWPMSNPDDLLKQSEQQGSQAGVSEQFWIPWWHKIPWAPNWSEPEEKKK